MISRTRSLASAVLVILVIIALGLFAGCGNKQEPSTADDLQTRARAMVEAIASGDYDTPVRDFDATMRKEMPAGTLQQAWESLLGRTGPFQSVTTTRVESAGGYEAVFVTCRFADASLNVKLVFDADGKVAGLFFVPVMETAEYQPPAYVDTSSFTESEVTVGSGAWALPGTITMPKGEGPFPGLVLVHGSGPNNRDESMGPVAPFKDIAWGLASRGIAVLRYDKRTLVYQSVLAQAGADITVREETVDDAVLALELLRSTPGVDPANVFVLGHSLGGMLIPRIAAAAPGARGFIALAGAARPLEDLVLEQAEYIASLDGAVTAEEQATLDQMREVVAKVKSPDLSADTPASELPLGTPGRYWLDLRGYEPAKEARSITRPLLILQGARDYQVTMADFTLWQEALSGMPNVTFETYPDLNHLFITGTGMSVPAEYQQPGHVSQVVVEDIAAFVLDNS